MPGYRRAIALLDTLDEPRALANFCSNLGLCEHELGQVAAARAHYARAIGLLERLGDARLLGIVLGNLGTLELAAGDVERALALHERACALLENGGDARSEGLGLARRAAALALLDRLEEAERQLVRAERVLRRDALGRAAADLLRGYLELGFARRHGRARAFDEADAQLAAAQARVDGATARARSVEAAHATGDDERPAPSGCSRQSSPASARGSRANGLRWPAIATAARPDRFGHVPARARPVPAVGAQLASEIGPECAHPARARRLLRHLGHHGQPIPIHAPPARRLNARTRLPHAAHRPRRCRGVRMRLRPGALLRGPDSGDAGEPTDARGPSILVPGDHAMRDAGAPEDDYDHDYDDDYEEGDPQPQADAAVPDDAAVPYMGAILPGPSRGAAVAIAPDDSRRGGRPSRRGFGQRDRD